MTIPARIRHECWVYRFGQVFRHKCSISWCNNEINVWNFHCGHDEPHSKGGTVELKNLHPICAPCNLSMSDKYTIKEWNTKIKTNSLCCWRPFST